MEGAKGEAIVSYCEPLATQQMRCHRLSQRVNNRTSKALKYNTAGTDYLLNTLSWYNHITLVLI